MSAEQPPSQPEERVAQWVSEHGRAVRGYLRALVRHEDEADDLVQEVFRRAWNARNRYQENGSARTYLLRIADRLACDRGRRSRREMNVNPNVWDAVEPQDTTAQPADAMKQGEARHLLAEALGQLNPVQKRVLLLRYYSDMPFGEIAKTLNCPLNTALSHCRRGLLALRKILAEDPL